MIFRIEFNPFSAEQVPNVNNVSWQWLTDNEAYVEMPIIPLCMDDLTDAEFLAGEDAFYMHFEEYCMADDVCLS
jgi:hypothetical protein